MNRSSFVGSIMCIACCLSANAQVQYEAGMLLGFQHTVARRGPLQATNVSDVKFLKPFTRSIGVLFDMKTQQKKLFYGIEFMNDNNDFGYKAESHDLNTSPGLSLTSGKMSSGDWIDVYKGGVRVGYYVYKRRKIAISGVVVPSLGYYNASLLLADTTGNSSWRRNLVEIQYITYPTWQRQGIYFFLKSTVEIQYSWTQHFATSFMMSYQQGFTPFVIDTTNIVRPYELTGPQEHKYWTKVNGTALQWHFGFKYIFGSVRRSRSRA